MDKMLELKLRRDIEGLTAARNGMLRDLRKSEGRIRILEKALQKLLDCYVVGDPGSRMHDAYENARKALFLTAGA